MNLNLAFPKNETIDIAGEKFNIGFSMRAFAIIERETGSIDETLRKLQNLGEQTLIEQLDILGILLYASLESCNVNFKYSKFEIATLVSNNNDLEGLTKLLVELIASAMPEDVKDDEVKNAPKVAKKRTVKK